MELFVTKLQNMWDKLIEMFVQYFHMKLLYLKFTNVWLKEFPQQIHHVSKMLVS